MPILPQLRLQATTQPRPISRFDIFERIEHILFLISSPYLGLTGLVQKYSASPVSQFVMEAFGGIDRTRSGPSWRRVCDDVGDGLPYHLRVIPGLSCLRVPWTMLPLMDDFTHLFQDISYYLGIRKHRAYYGRYNYAEKVEYLAVVWGTIIMGLTGFMMWNPITTTKYLPGEVIPAAKVAHGGKPSWRCWRSSSGTCTMCTSNASIRACSPARLTHEEMEEEHPAELELIETGAAWQRPTPELIRRRQRTFIPVAVVLALVLSWGVI